MHLSELGAAWWASCAGLSSYKNCAQVCQKQWPKFESKSKISKTKVVGGGFDYCRRLVLSNEYSHCQLLHWKQLVCSTDNNSWSANAAGTTQRGIPTLQVFCFLVLVKRHFIKHLLSEIICWNTAVLPALWNAVLLPSPTPTILSQLMRALFATLHKRISCFQLFCFPVSKQPQSCLFWLTSTFYSRFSVPFCPHQSNQVIWLDISTE